MKIAKHSRLAAVFAIAAVCASATVSIASTNTAVPTKDHVMTDPCARVMNWPHRALIAFAATPPSERGLQCPIEEDFGPPANE